MERTVDDYIRTLTSAQQFEFNRIKSIVEDVVPTVVQGTSYAMPAFMYKGKPLLSIKVNKKFLSLYPFSGKVIDKLREQLDGFELTAGSVHFSLEKPVPEGVLREMLTERIGEIGENI
jgi:uncharacterized protein YdhG (YjbR/CyaY superfamily)